MFDRIGVDLSIIQFYRQRSRTGPSLLKEYIVKGFALNDDRFNSGSSMDYFAEIQEAHPGNPTFRTVFPADFLSGGQVRS